ncbi:MAG: hypothetical protein ACXWJK_12960 [Burkholderiaceae bacterium]
MATFKPYQNEADSIAIDELTIENRLDKISVYGSLDLTKDKAGLQQAKQLKELLDAAVTVLEAEKNLPDHIAVKPAEKVDNPFK